MIYSIKGKYRGSKGTLMIGKNKLVFKRKDGLGAAKEQVLVDIPSHVIMATAVEGRQTKKMTVLVDPRKMPGVMRHEFEVPQPYECMCALQTKMNFVPEKTNPS